MVVTAGRTAVDAPQSSVPDPTIDVVVAGSRVALEREVFTLLFGNSVVSSRADYQKAVETGRITFKELIELARLADIPYSLFLAPLPLVAEQVALKSQKLLQGISKRTFSMNTRNSVQLSDIELIVKDLIRKQEELKRLDPTLKKNPLVGALRRPATTHKEDAERLMELLELAPGEIQSQRTKQGALDVLTHKLEAKQVLVARSQRLFMPQMLDRVKFSGMTIKDSKVPYIFLAGGDEGDHLEPTGRRIFTLTLMAVLVARGVFAPVTYDGNALSSEDSREYDIVGEILMPTNDFVRRDISSLAAMKEAADQFNVTPSAVVVRALRLGRLNLTDARIHLDQLKAEYAARGRTPSNTPKTVNALRNYNGLEFSRRMLRALDAGRLPSADFCRIVCQNRIKPSQISDFRAAIR